MNKKELKEAEAGMDELATVSLTGDLEEEFRAVHKLAMKRINERLAKIDELHAECEKISEKSGVPFHTKMFNMEQQWTPKTFHERQPTYEDNDKGYESEYAWEAVLDSLNIRAYAREGFSADGRWSSSSIYC